MKKREIKKVGLKKFIWMKKCWMKEGFEILKNSYSNSKPKNDNNFLPKSSSIRG